MKWQRFSQEESLAQVWAWDCYSLAVDKSALKISVTWGWGLVLGAKCISLWIAKM